MRLTHVLLLLSLGLLSTGCGRGPEAVDPIDRKKSASLVSEAVFAVQIREYDRASELYAEAGKLDPWNVEAHVGLGVARRRLDDRAGAKTAYRRAREVCADLHKRNPEDTELVLRQVYLSVLLGDESGARKRLDEAVADHAGDPKIGAFVREGALDRMLADPRIREISLL